MRQVTQVGRWPTPAATREGGVGPKGRLRRQPIEPVGAQQHTRGAAGAGGAPAPGAGPSPPLPPSPISTAHDAGYVIAVHVVLIPEDLAVERVNRRVRHGGHDGPEGKIRERHRRLWQLVADAIEIAATATGYDNSRRDGPRIVAQLTAGTVIGAPTWPAWASEGYSDAGRARCQLEHLRRVRLLFARIGAMHINRRDQAIADPQRSQGPRVLGRTRSGQRRC